MTGGTCLLVLVQAQMALEENMARTLASDAVDGVLW